MKKILRSLLMLLLAGGIFTACQKELSLDTGGDGPVAGEGTAVGELGGSPGACTNTVVKGAYGEGITLTDSNEVWVDVNFSAAGTYNISTDTLNGYYFNGTGTVSAAGLVSVKLRGKGTPVVAGVNNFTVKFKGTNCGFPVTVLPVVPTPTTGDYFPMTTNSYWTYLNTDPSAPADDSLRYTVNANNITINGVAGYRIFVSNDDDSSFYRKSGNDYLQFGDLDIVGASSDVIPAEWTFLKDNVAVNTTWESAVKDASIGGQPGKIKLQFKIIAKDVSASANGNVYSNVIKVRVAELVQVPGSTSFVEVFSAEVWYAKGIGMINIVSQLPVYGKLLNYKVF